MWLKDQHCQGYCEAHLPCRWDSATSHTLGHACHIEIVTVCCAALPRRLSRCSVVSSLVQAVAHLFPQPQGSVVVFYSCTIAWWLLRCIATVSQPTWNSKQTDWIQNQPLLAFTSTRDLHPCLDLRYPYVLLPCSGFVTIPRWWLGWPGGFAGLQSSAELHLQTGEPLPFTQAFSLGWLHS